MPSALLRGRSSTTSRTMPRYTSSLTDLSRNGEIPMMNWEGGALLTPSPAAPASGGKKFRAQSPTTRPGTLASPHFFPRQVNRLSVSVQIVASRDDFLHERFLLPLPATQERGEDRGEGHLLSPTLSSTAWRRGSVRLRLRRAVLYRMAASFIAVASSLIEA